MNESDQIYVDQPQADLRSLRKDPVYLTLMRAYGSRFVEIIIAGVLINVFGPWRRIRWFLRLSPLYAARFAETTTPACLINGFASSCRSIRVWCTTR